MYDEDQGTAVLGMALAAGTGIAIGWYVVGVLVVAAAAVVVLRYRARR